MIEIKITLMLNYKENAYSNIKISKIMRINYTSLPLGM